MPDDLDLGPAPDSPEMVTRACQLLDSFERRVGRPLLAECGPELTPAERALRLHSAPLVVVAHGVADDPRFDFANRLAAELFAMPRSQLLGTPSRLSAEPVHRDERAALMRRAAASGHIADYQGIRITADGRRFRIERAIVWNVDDDQGRPAGQAAAFAEWVWVM